MHYSTSCNTQSNDPEDGRDRPPKHVELVGIFNKLLLLHLVGFLYYLVQCRPDWPLSEAVAIFHLLSGHDCLAEHLCHVGLLPQAYRTLCDGKEIERQRLLRCTVLPFTSADPRRWETRLRMCE